MQIRGKDQSSFEAAKNGSVPDGCAVVGAHADNAVAFVEWLNPLLEGDILYRLPRRSELEYPVVSSNPALGGLCAWCSPNTGTGDLDLWAAPDTPNPYAVSSHELRERVRADAAGSIAVLVGILLTLVAVHALAYARANARVLGQSLDRGDINGASDLERVVSSAMTRADALVHAVALDREAFQDQALARSLAEARALARSNARGLCNALDQALTRIRYQRDLTHDSGPKISYPIYFTASYREKDHNAVQEHLRAAHARIRGSIRAQSIAGVDSLAHRLDFDSNRASALDLYASQALTRARGHVSGNTEGLDYSLGLGLGHGHGLGLDLDLDLGLDPHHNLASDRDLTRARDRARRLAETLDLDVDLPMCMFLTSTTPGFPETIWQPLQNAAGQNAVRTVLPNALFRAGPGRLRRARSARDIESQAERARLAYDSKS